MSIEVAAKEVMDKNVDTIDLNKTAVDAAKLMATGGRTSVVVVEGEVSVGIVTERDLVTKVMSEPLDPSKVLVRDIMSTPLITSRPETKLRDIADLMMEYKIRRVVIVDDNGLLAGMVSATDLSRTLTRQKASQDPALAVLARIHEAPSEGPYQ